MSLMASGNAQRMKMRLGAVNARFPFNADGVTGIVGTGSAEARAQRPTSMTIFPATVGIHQHSAREVISKT